MHRSRGKGWRMLTGQNHFMKRIILSLLALTGPILAEETIIQASGARCWLKVPADQPSLKDVRISSGTVTSAAWEKDPAIRERQLDVMFPIRWWSWNETVLEFTPAYDGPLELQLCGPWQTDKDGAIFRQEILWDGISATGAMIRNGDFESLENQRPADWTSSGAAYPAPDAWPVKGVKPLAGNQMAATWHNRTLSQTIQVKSGKPVRIRMHAKAATPPDFIAPKILGQATPAHRALARMKRGVNLGNGWEADPSWKIRFTAEDIDHIADQGFDHVRVPVGFHFYLKDDKDGLEMSQTLLDELEPVLRRALERKLIVLLDWHHFNDFTKAPDMHLSRFIAGWECIARHFKSWPPGLYFELLNEPHDAMTTEVCNRIYPPTITAIRRINHDRIIIASPGSWGGIGELEKMRLPDQDDRIIVTVHCYEPFHFTHQGAGWVGFQALKGVIYPGPPQTPLQVPESLKGNAGVSQFIESYNTLPADRNPSSSTQVKKMLDAVRAWSLEFGRPVHLGEFGAHNIGDDASRARYLHDVKNLAEERKIPWTLWEWKSSFGYWDPQANQPRFRAALFE